MKHLRCSSFTVLISLLLGVSEGSYSSLSQNSRYQSYPMVMCNNSQIQPLSPVQQIIKNPSPEEQALMLQDETIVKPEAISYFTPTILNYSPNIQNAEGYDEIGIGNRISMPSSQPVQGTVWMPERLALPTRMVTNQNNLNREEDQKYIIDVNTGVRFFLFTRKNPIVAQQIFVNQKETIENSHFNASRPTKLIFHGFTDVDAAGDWVNKIKEAYLSVSDVNVIVADHSSFSLFLLFQTNLPIFASKRLVDMIMFLEMDAGASRESFHLIARSWACHVVGMTGRLLGGQIGRITGLEPAEKLAINGAPEYKLVREDAQFVDLIHINGKRFFFHGAPFGLFAPSGHVDVYPNIAERGLGCPGESFSTRRYSLKFCQLGRGVRYFTNSIKYPSLYPMCPCESFEMYKAGRCSCSQRVADTNKVYMGDQISNQTRGVFQLAAATTTAQLTPLLSRYQYISPVFG